MLSVMEAQIHSLMQDLSNGKPIEISEPRLAQAAEEIVSALKKQLCQEQEKSFRIRMSNVGRPLCTLQMKKKGADEGPMPYNHIMRMMIGDCVEVITRLIIEAAGINVTSDGDNVKLKVSKTEINGTSDIDIDGKIYDIKSSAPWAFDNKWAHGFEALLKEDDFGYVGQLFGYADAQKKEPGGWIVVNKSTGEVKVVECTASPSEKKAIRAQRKATVEAIERDAPFQKGFEDEEERFNKKPTGGRILKKACMFCGFKKECWPTVEYRPSPSSKSQTPPWKWYTVYPNVD